MTWDQRKTLGKRLHLDSGTLTPLLKRMASMGLLSRERSAEDERKVLILLSPKGKDLKTKALDIPKEMMCKSGLTMGQYHQLKQNLEILLENIAQ